MDSKIRKYLSAIGKKGGKKSRRTLSAEQSRTMVRVRVAKRAFRRFYASCFWSFDPNYRITASDITWVADQLMRNGDREAWEVGAKLCH